MKKIIRSILLITSLLLISSIFYIVDYFLFGDLQGTITGVLLNLAYVPLGMIYQTFLVDKILEQRDKINGTKKMNLVIGSFYHEIGCDVIGLISKGDLHLNQINNSIKKYKEWNDEKFYLLLENLDEYKCNLDINNIDLVAIQKLLEDKDDFILSLITNSTVDDYDNFIKMLMSLIHLRDELQQKYYKEIETKPEKSHAINDVCDAYTALLSQWGDYMKNLKEIYPMLFIKALESSPFN